MKARTAILLLLPCALARGDLSSGLVAHYALDGDATDATGLHDGTVHGAAWTEGAIGQGLHFDGDDDYMTAANAPSQQITRNQLTVAAWIRMAGAVEDGLQSRIVSKQQTHGVAWGLEIFAPGRRGATGHQLTFHDSDGIIAWQTVLAPTHLEIGRLYHVAATDDAGLITLYIDGRPDVTYSGGLGIPALIEAPLFVGCAGVGKAHFHGVIDDVRIYDRVLSAAEIEALSVVPLPGAALLGVLGLGCAGMRLRRAA